VLTPAGYSYIGDKIITSYITNNAITGSSVGIKILNGDNNIINNNVIRYNTNSAITIAVSSRNNVIQNNNLNNNIFGAVIAGANTYITQNTVKNNSDTGLVITSKPLYFSYNNLYNNKKYNLNNTIYNLSAENNYWGDGNSVDIEAGLSMTIASSTYLVDYDSYAKEIISFDSLVDPVLKTVDRTTTASFVYFSGLKPVGVDVYLNSNLLDVSSDENSWAFNASLELGENGFYIYYKDVDGNKSNRENISVQRYEILAAPTINSHEKKTTLESMILSGVKPVGSSLLLDGQEIKSVSNESTWSYNLDLEMGENIFSLTAYDSESEQTSLVTAININRTKDIIADTIAAEKAASVTPDVKLSARLAGRLLLQVENDGVIWYVNPKNGERYLVTLDNALNLFRSLSLGITEENLAKLPTRDSGESGDSALMERLAGKLLLRVEKAGRIAYIDYQGYRYDVSRDNLMDIFRSLSLGISNENIYKIPVGETE
jgi:hypothetical protein